MALQNITASEENKNSQYPKFATHFNHVHSTTSKHNVLPMIMKDVCDITQPMETYSSISRDSCRHNVEMVN